MPENVLSIDHLTAGYGEAAVLHDVTLHVGEGEVVALLGPNGAGKTTTLRAISGVVHGQGGLDLLPRQRTSRRPRSAPVLAEASRTCPRTAASSSR